MCSQCWTFFLMEIFQLPPQVPFTRPTLRGFVTSSFWREISFSIALYSDIVRAIGSLVNEPKSPLSCSDCNTQYLLTSYVIVGKWQSLGVLILSTESYENRVIPSGVNPAFSSTFGIPSVLNSSHALSSTA